MPELRKDPIVGRWVIISTERAKRPKDFAFTPEVKKIQPQNCPFCPGNEATTPPEVLAYRPGKTAPNSPGWTIRVVPNKFPALRIEGELNKKGEGIYDKMNGIGAHEVVIETPEHQLDLPDLDDNTFKDIVWSFRERTLELKKDPRFRYVLIFKNFGAAAGASLEHTHSQLIATPVVPKRVSEEMDGAKRYYEYRERCIFCDMIKQELKDQSRLVSENSQCVAFTPYAPRFPFETWILFKRHISSFEGSNEEETTGLAQILKVTLRKLRTALNSPPYNFVLHTAPLNLPSLEFFHFHIEIIPVLTRIAGFEWGTGFFINPTPPEEAADFLKKV